MGRLLQFRAACRPCTCRLVLVARGDGWSTAALAIWPDAFKHAVQTLLLAAHRLACEAGSCDGSRRRLSRAARAAQREARREGGAPGGGATLGSLPPELLVQIAEKAAFPVSIWM